MQKGVLRIEPNVSVRPKGSHEYGTRTEVKNLNSFRALERSVAYEIERQTDVLDNGGEVVQETRGWDESSEVTFSQRRKEEEEDYRYFPEPDLPPLVVDPEWLNSIRENLPELPMARRLRLQDEYGLLGYDAGVLIDEKAVADYFEGVIAALPGVNPKTVSNWITGDMFGLMNRANLEIYEVRVSPRALAGLIDLVQKGEINQKTAKRVLSEMFDSGRPAREIVDTQDLGQISDTVIISEMVEEVLAENPEQVMTYLKGKETLSQWFYGLVMRAARGKANPQVVQAELDRQLEAFKRKKEKY
jgi:aspartyl-tRNA(Asn)/glutamyl-tRNA(Gln) amidotransferase subunit B